MAIRIEVKPDAIEYKCVNCCCMNCRSEPLSLQAIAGSISIKTRKMISTVEVALIALCGGLSFQERLVAVSLPSLGLPICHLSLGCKPAKAELWN